VNTAKLAENPAVKAFVDYYLSDDGLVTGVTEAGYIQLPADRVETTRSAWDGAAA
jgi:ABC-type phosphate transport system substrate-binding protein